MKYGIILSMVIFSACGRGHDGRNGIDGATGATGSQGAQGQVGPQGNTGAAGANGTTVTVVRLCPNNPAPSYGNFPEQALCIGGKLYGIYNTQSNGLDFLSELPPGNYASVAPSGCNLTIGAACAVTQN